MGLIMLNGNSILSMLERPNIKIEYTEPTKDNRTGKPFKRTLDGVMNAVKGSEGINRKGIIDITEYSNHCVDRCLDYLIENESLTREFVRMSGPYKVYRYLINNNQTKLA